MGAEEPSHLHHIFVASVLLHAQHGGPVLVAFAFQLTVSTKNLVWRLRGGVTMLATSVESAGRSPARMTSRPGPSCVRLVAKKRGEPGVDGVGIGDGSDVMGVGDQPDLHQGMSRRAALAAVSGR